MKVGRSMLAIVAVSWVGVVVPRTAAADERNKQTVLTFSQDVEIPGKVLPAGTYVFRLGDSATNRHVVQVFDQAGRILATVFTIPAARPTASADTRITFEKQRAGAPLPIKKWFTPAISMGRNSSIRRTPTDKSSTEPHPAFEVLESRVGTERIEPRPQKDTGIESLLAALFEPMSSLDHSTRFLVPQRRISRNPSVSRYLPGDP